MNISHVLCPKSLVVVYAQVVGYVWVGHRLPEPAYLAMNRVWVWLNWAQILKVQRLKWMKRIVAQKPRKLILDTMTMIRILMHARINRSRKSHSNFATVTVRLPEPQSLWNS